MAPVSCDAATVAIGLPCRARTSANDRRETDRAVQRREKYSLGGTPSALRNIAANALGLS